MAGLTCPCCERIMPGSAQRWLWRVWLCVFSTLLTLFWGFSCPNLWLKAEVRWKYHSSVGSWRRPGRWALTLALTSGTQGGQTGLQRTKDASLLENTQKPTQPASGALSASTGMLFSSPSPLCPWGLHFSLNAVYWLFLTHLV